jgi:beta-glucosidase
VDITNTGERDADEVAQLYLTHAPGRAAPLRALKGFQRVHLKKGETRTVRFTLTDRDVSIVNPRGRHIVAAGDLKVWVGGGQPIAPPGLAVPPGVTAQFTIQSNRILPN